MSVLLLRKLVDDIFELPTGTEDSLSVSASIYKTTLKKAVLGLPMKEGQIILGLYSLEGDAETVVSLGRKMSLSRGRIATLQQSAITRLSKMKLIHPVAEALEVQGAASMILQRVCIDASDTRLLKTVRDGVCPVTALFGCSVRILELSARSENLLVSNDILSIEDLIGRTAKNIVDLPKVGDAILKEIESKLKEIGLILTD